jgi:hypothetical protein
MGYFRAIDFLTFVLDITLNIISGIGIILIIAVGSKYNGNITDFSYSLIMISNLGDMFSVTAKQYLFMHTNLNSAERSF